LIGRQVTARVGSQEVTGVVESALMEDGEVFVVFGENKVPFTNILSVGPATPSTAEPTQEEAATET
jgi:hypothetical protein